jgi:glycosyltransferase involved in cell wall biosynthesis
MILFVVPLDGNPYQELLYGPMRSAHPTFKTLYWRRRRWIGIPYFFVLSVWAVFRGARLVHVHWLAWDLRFALPMRRVASGIISRTAIRWLRLLRFRIIWTAHNVLPHEPQSDDDVRVGRLLAESASAIIVHSAVNLDSLTSYGFPVQSAVVIPQGNYVGRYGASTTTRSDAQQKLGISTSSRTILFFGLIRPYKGIPELLVSWKNLKIEGTLLIAGACSDEDLIGLIDNTSIGDSSIDARIGFVADDDVPDYFAACDAVCLPFRRITTSSSALLALSFGRPLIAPRIGALEDLPENVGFFYGDETGLTLTDALRQFFDASDQDLSDRMTNARRYAMSLSWSAIAERTFNLYETVLEGTPEAH